ncbi:NAD-dependent epimerase/dehydratase family protein [Asticcacaulis sp. AND118]|uniref:NAD-dependent epimerase/dehydratase family protein n=1 Tax=Asticcacaulis sp. AND118 TaxID=2840468 RepID=UPI001CFFCAE4|nr:NAD-dependent epimerase/dehydratase family protein [Asticcacaulis sp. AND118]UDF05464.1 NAD-dependent epimerase/dehydratase family protein [Asticcacaulis sp. AND118]
MSEKIVIFGYGPGGRSLTERLIAAGRQPIVTQRSRPKDLPPGVDFVATDVRDAAAVQAVSRGASHIVVTVGFPYSTRVWRQSWPIAMTHLLAAARATGAKTLFFDNLYMYGPQNGPISETTPYARWGGKPAVRRAISEQWQTAVAKGEVLMSALRVPDFYGPGVSNSHLGDLVFGRLAQGKPAQIVAPPDMPHDFAYIPDVARAMERLLDLPEAEYGQVWHMPSAPTRTLRDLITIGARTLGQKPKIQAVPPGLFPVLGLVTPFMRELHDMRFLFDRPYHIDGGKLTRRFGFEVTPFEVGVPEAARSYRQ